MCGFYVLNTIKVCAHEKEKAAVDSKMFAIYSIASADINNNERERDGTRKKMKINGKQAIINNNCIQALVFCSYIKC